MDHDVHTCFMARPMGNIYDTPLIEIWNSPEAVLARRQMLATRYEKAGCSPEWCAWREGKSSTTLKSETRQQMIAKFRSWTEEVLENRSTLDSPTANESGSSIAAVRRRLNAQARRIKELEKNLVDLCDKNLSGSSFLLTGVCWVGIYCISSLIR